MDFFRFHIGSIGLILDMIGVSILFLVVISAGEQVRLANSNEEALRKKKIERKKVLLNVGYVFILIGFILQLISNEMKTK